MIGAVIYIRVSTKEQTENLSLATQLQACEDYCLRNGLTALATFREEGESAKSADRTELQRLLTYCRTHKGRVQFVVVYNLTRFARHTYDHFALRSLLGSFGITLRSATESIDDTPSGKLIEGVLAVVAQHDNDVRSERVRAGMKANLETGRWVFLAPLGYVNAPKSPSLLPDPDRAPHVRQAFTDVAGGRITKGDALKRATAAGLRTRRGRPVPSQTFDDVLRNPVYRGWVDVPDYDVSRKGDFEPIVDEATWYRVQAVLAGKLAAITPKARSNADFPLRGFVRCGRCERGVTGSWSKGRSGYYAYYHCQDRCRTVNISKATLEAQFVELLGELQPTPGFMRLVKEHVLVAWRTMQTESKVALASAERQTRTIQERLDRLDEAFVFQQAIDRSTYERQRDRLREELTLARMNQHSAALEELDVEGILAFAAEVLPSAANLWAQASLDQRQRLQKVFFANGLVFEEGRIVRTVATLPFTNKLGSGLADKTGVVDLTGSTWNQLTTWLKAVDTLRAAA